MYQSGIIFERTREEQQDVFLSWHRPDRAFFAAGGCHILGHLFTMMHQHQGFQLIHIQPHGEHSGHHMYSSDGKWAFDFNGWTLEEEVLREHAKAYRSKYPDWQYDRIIVPTNWAQYIQHIHNTRHRPPEYFPELPWKRAYEYIQQFPAQPPELR